MAIPPRKRKTQRSEVRKVEETGQIEGRSQPGSGARTLVQGVLGRGVPDRGPFLSTVSTFGSTSVEQVCVLNTSAGVTAEPRNHTPVGTTCVWLPCATLYRYEMHVCWWKDQLFWLCRAAMKTLWCGNGSRVEQFFHPMHGYTHATHNALIELC